MSGVVGRPSWRARSGREAIMEGQKWLGGPRRAGSGWEALSEGREW